MASKRYLNNLYFMRVFILKRFFILSSFRRVFGIGLTRSKKVFSLLGLNPKFKKKSFFRYYYLYINQDKLNTISVAIEKSYIIDYELKSFYSNNIRILKNIKSYRGFRHIMMLPTRGQRSHTNASTLRKILLSKRKRKINVYKKK